MLDEGRELNGYSNLRSQNFVIDGTREKNEDYRTNF